MARMISKTLVLVAVALFCQANAQVSVGGGFSGLIDRFTSQLGLNGGPRPGIQAEVNVGGRRPGSGLGAAVLNAAAQFSRVPAIIASTAFDTAGRVAADISRVPTTATSLFMEGSRPANGAGASAGVSAGGRPGYGAQGSFTAGLNGRPGNGAEGSFTAGVNGRPSYGAQGSYGVGLTGRPGYDAQGSYGVGLTGRPGYGAQGSYGVGLTGRPGYGAQGSYGVGLTGRPAYGTQGSFGAGLNGRPSYGAQGSFGAGYNSRPGYDTPSPLDAHLNSLPATGALDSFGNVAGRPVLDYNFDVSKPSALVPEYKDDTLEQISGTAAGAGDLTIGTDQETPTLSGIFESGQETPTPNPSA